MLVFYCEFFSPLHRTAPLTRIIASKGCHVVHDVGVVDVGLEGDEVVGLVT